MRNAIGAGSRRKGFQGILIRHRHFYLQPVSHAILSRYPPLSRRIGVKAETPVLVAIAHLEGLTRPRRENRNFSIFHGFAGAIPAGYRQPPGLYGPLHPMGQNMGGKQQ